MSAVLAIGFLFGVIHLFIQFGRHECVCEEYEDTVLDVESRLEWARERTRLPFGMKAQIEVAGELLGRAKNLWQRNKWHQAYRVAIESQKAIDKAQSLYTSVIRSHQKKKDDGNTS